MFTYKKVLSKLISATFSIFFLFYLGYILPAKSLEEQNKNKIVEEESIISPLKWTEALKLRDYYLLPELPEVKLSGKLTSYKEALAKEYEKTPNVFSAAVQYGLLLIDLGELDKAQAVWERAVNDFMSNPTPKAYKAWVDACKGNYLQAKEAWLPIAQQKIDNGIVGLGAGIWLPSHIDSVVGLSLIKNYLPSKDKKEAEEAVQKIVTHFSNIPKFASILTAEDLQNGKLKKASLSITNILTKFPDDPITLTLDGIEHLINGQYEDALKSLDKANEMYSNSPINNLMRARALFALKKEKESFALFDKLAKFDPVWNLTKGEKKKFLAGKSYVEETKNKKTGKEIVPES